MFQECKDVGAAQPKLELSGHDLWIEFPFARTGSPAGSVVEVGVESSEKSSEKIMALMKTQPRINLADFFAQTSLKILNSLPVVSQ